MQVLVRAVVEAAHDVRDPEVRVVDDAREVIGRGAVFAEQRDAVEPLAELRSGLPVAVLPLALPHGPFVPREAEPLEVADDLLLTAGHVALGIRVVDPQQHPVPQTAVCDRAEGVTYVQGARRARREADSLHLRPSLRAAPRAPRGPARRAGSDPRRSWPGARERWGSPNASSHVSRPARSRSRSRC